MHLLSGQPINTRWWDRVKVHIQKVEESCVANENALLWPKWSHLYNLIPRYLQTDVRQQQHPWERSYVALHLFVKNALETTLSCRMSVAAHNTPVVASKNTAEPLIQKKLQWTYPEVINYLQVKFANYQAIAVMDSDISRYIQPAHITPMHNANDLYAEACKVADVYDELTLYHNFIEGVNPFISQSLQKYWATYS